MVELTAIPDVEAQKQILPVQPTANHFPDWTIGMLENNLYSKGYGITEYCLLFITSGHYTLVTYPEDGGWIPEICELL
jgi:hypothetical protein